MLVNDIPLEIFFKLILHSITCKPQRRDTRSRPAQFSSVDVAALQLWPQIALRHKYSRLSISITAAEHADLREPHTDYLNISGVQQGSERPQHFLQSLSFMFVLLQVVNPKNRQDVWVSAKNILSDWCTLYLIYICTEICLLLKMLPLNV